MAGPVQGDIFWHEAEDERRPVLVVTRSHAIDRLRWLVVAPITRRIRDIPTEIRLGSDEGLRFECVASFDNLKPVRKAHLHDRIGSLGRRRDEICLALRELADC